MALETVKSGAQIEMRPAVSHHPAALVTKGLNPVTSKSDFYSVRLSCAETATLVRQTLRKEFPGVKFSVRAKTYAGGASISVSWTGGPGEAVVRAKVDRYAGADFDGMTDMKLYRPSTLLANEDGSLEDVRYGADFVQVQRSIGDEERERYRADIEALIGEFEDTRRIPVYVDHDGTLYRLASGDEWASTVIHQMSVARANLGGGRDA
jgi:hypothetical protein